MFKRLLTAELHSVISKSVSSLDGCSRTRLFQRGSALIVIACLATACASPSKESTAVTIMPSGIKSYKEVKLKAPTELKIKGVPKTTESVDYYHVSGSRAYEGTDLRHEKTEQMSFTAEATTLKADANRITQQIVVTKKEGTMGLHDFAMPEPGERLEMTAASNGKILKAGDWPNNSIFFVPPVSLPEQAVEVGDTWTMQASWLSLNDMVPYQLDMVSILKNFVQCGNDTCAEIEVNGDVTMQGQLQQTIAFKSEWRGRLLFALGAGTVVWSRVNSEETFAYDKVFRKVGSCLEASLREPALLSLGAKPTCEGFAPPTDRR